MKAQSQNIKRNESPKQNIKRNKAQSKNIKRDNGNQDEVSASCMIDTDLIKKKMLPDIYISD